jgi:hypothetical protein
MANQPRMLILGLGGTGLEALLHLKALFSQHPGEVPPYCRLLYLDTVAPKELGGVSLRDVESAVLLLRDPAEVLRNPSNGHIRQWFPEIRMQTVQTAVYGAAQIRPLGRLALHAQPERVVSQITTCLDTLTDRERLREGGDRTSIDGQGSVEVYVLTSLCGGTGSGVFIEVARLVREELKDAPTVRLVGVFLLPGPFRGLPGTDLVRSNAYAALKELDYLPAPREPLSLTFGQGRTLVFDRSPFDLVYLVDSVGERYDTTKSVSHLARQMAYLPYLMSTPSVGSLVREVLHNLIPQLESKGLVHGKRATYASFGVATLELPKSSVLSARRDFESELLKQLVDDKEGLQPLADLGTRDALEKCAVTRVPEHLEMLLLEVNFANPKEPIDKLEEIYAATLNQVEEYARTSAKPHLDQLRELGERAIRKLVRDASVNPGCLLSASKQCSRLLADLKTAQDSLRTPTKQADHAEKERKRAWESCRAAFKSRRRSKRELAANEWTDIVNSLVLPVRLLDAENAVAVDAVGFLIDRVREAEHWCSTAKRNIENLLTHLAKEQVPPVVPPTPFTHYGEATRIRPTADARKFLASIPDARSWFVGPEPAMWSAIAAFSDREFDPAFLPGGASSATRLVINDQEGYINELRRFSAPMWSYSVDKIPPEHQRGIHHLEVLGVDKRSGEVEAIQSQYPNINIISTGWSDRVLYLQLRAGIPLFALTHMDDLWRDYARRWDGAGQEICHIDRHWAGWPELLPHAFDAEVLDLFAQGLASSHITRSSRAFQYHDNSTNRSLGASFLEAYQSMTSDKELLRSISSSVQNTNGYSAGERWRRDLWQFLVNDEVAVEDRPLVEALLYNLERFLKRAKRGATL